MKSYKILAALIVVIIALAGFTACSLIPSGPVAHEHDFSAEWNSNADHHWHACNGEGCDEVADSAAHTFGEGVVTTPATEDAEGLLTYKCTVCGFEKTEILDKISHVHQLSKVDEVPATCTEAGVEVYYVCECGKLFSDEAGVNEIANPVVIPAKGHSDEIVAGKDATCTETGITDGKHCTVCGAVTLAHEVIPAKGHSDETVAGKDATCTESGLTDGKKCSVCGVTTLAQDLIPAKGHTDVDSDYTCDACGTKLCVFHTPAEAVKENEVASSCIATGSYESVVYCSICKAEISRETITVGALGHTYENCVCTVCKAVLPALSQNESFQFSSQDAFDAVVAEGKLIFVGSFRDNSGSFQFNTNSNIQFVVPANTTVIVTGHSEQYGVFNIYLNGEKAELTAENGVYKFIVTSETNVVVATGDNGASYSYIKSIVLEEYKDRTISADTTITFGSEGNYKDSIVDFSGIQIGDNGGNNSQVKNGSFDLLLKAGSKVVIHGYPGYTSYQLNGGEAIESEYYTYIALADTVLTVTPVSGNNYFYSIEITLHEGIAQVEGKAADCENAGYEAYYSCTCHGELTEKVVINALGHKEQTIDGKDATCTENGMTAGKKCTTCGTVLVEQKEIIAIGHKEYSAKENEIFASCTSAGSYDSVVYCSVCNVEIKRENIKVDILKHDLNLVCVDADGHYEQCKNCDYHTEKVAHAKSEEGKCACGYACEVKCDVCGECLDSACVLCDNKCDFIDDSRVIPFAPSTTIGDPEGPDGLAPGKEGAYIKDGSIVAEHIILENGAYATLITLPNGTAAHSGISLQNNKNHDAFGKEGYNCGIPQLANVVNIHRLYFTNHGDSEVTFIYSSIDYYFNKGAVTVTLAPGESKIVLMPVVHTADSVGLNHQIVFPEGAEAGASVSVWGEYVANANLSGISVSTSANQIRFGVGETFNAEGLVLKANGTNFNRVYISGNYITNFDGYTFTEADVGTKVVFVLFGDYAVTYTITVDDHIHNVVYVDEQAPIQCEKDGLAAHYYCAVCNTMFADQYGNNIIENIASVSCHTAPTSGVLPGAAINCVHCGTSIGVASMDNWVHFAITTDTSSIGSNIKNGKLEHGYVNGIPGTKISIGAGTVGATNDSAFYLKMSNNDSGWQTVIPNLGSNAPSGQLRKVVLYYVNYGSEAVTLNLQNDARGGNGKVTIPANGTAICEFTIKNAGGSNWFYLYVDSNLTTDVVIGMYGYFYVYSEEVDSISVNKQANKLTYKVGESFTSEGLVVNVPITMSNSKTCYANTGFTTNFDGRTFTADDIGVHTVTVTFGDNTTTYTIEVVPEVDCNAGEHKYDKVSDESLFVEMQGNDAIYKKSCVYCGAVSDETYVADTIAFVPHATNKTNFIVEYIILPDGRIGAKLTAVTDIVAGTKTSISTSINTIPSNTNVVMPVSGNGRRFYMEMVSNANVNITWQPEFYGDRDGVTMELVAGEAQSAVWVVKYDTTTNASQTAVAIPYQEFVFNSDVAAGTEIILTGLFYDRGDVIGVDVKNPANKIIYKVGEEFTSEGFSLKVDTRDSLVSSVTIWNVTTDYDGKVFTEDDLGTHAVTVSWGEYTYEYHILVIE